MVLLCPTQVIPLQRLISVAKGLVLRHVVHIVGDVRRVRIRRHNIAFVARGGPVVALLMRASNNRLLRSEDAAEIDTAAIVTSVIGLQVQVFNRRVFFAVRLDYPLVQDGAPANIHLELFVLVEEAVVIGLTVALGVVLRCTNAFARVRPGRLG